MQKRCVALDHHLVRRFSPCALFPIEDRYNTTVWTTLPYIHPPTQTLEGIQPKVTLEEIYLYFIWIVMLKYNNSAIDMLKSLFRLRFILTVLSHPNKSLFDEQTLFAKWIFRTSAKWVVQQKASNINNTNKR